MRSACPDAELTPNYSGAVLGIGGGDPSFRADDGAADPHVVAALEAFAVGTGSEHAAMIVLAASRLLVPVVPVRAGAGQATEMALPTLIGMDGRRALPAFTCMESMRRWQQDARPVPAAARQVWLAASQERSAVVIDVAGPVPFAVEGARLAALARGEAAPPPWADPDVREIVADVLATHLDVASFELGPGDAERDMAIGLALAGGGGSAGGGGAGGARGAADPGGLAACVGAEVMARLGGRLRRGVQVWLGLPGAKG